MNIRLQQFADQANEYANSVHIQWLGPEEMNPKWMPCRDKKFAELIVRECLEACSRANEIRHFVPPTQQQVVLSCMYEIERTFSGVEE